MTSKYDRLADYLATFDGPEITLTFAQVEAVVGPLPVTARQVSSWWGRGGRARYLNPYVLHWREAGYVAERLDVKAETVRFRRVAP